MRACWAATLPVLVQPSPASCATCRGTSSLPRVLALTHRHRHKSPCVRQPFAEISGSIAFSPLWFLSRKLCLIFVCQFKGSLHVGAASFPERRLWTPRHKSDDRPENRTSGPLSAGFHFDDYRVNKDLWLVRFAQIGVLCDREVII